MIVPTVLKNVPSLLSSLVLFPSLIILASSEVSSKAIIMSSTYPEVGLISRSNFAFSNALHEQLRINGEGGNLVYSPFSLGLVLLLARFGARGTTAEQLDRVLNPTGNAPMMLDDLVPIRRGFFRVLKSIQTDKSADYNVTVANRMFTGIGFNVRQDFRNISRATLDVKVKQLDFTKDGGKPAAEAINSWVANKTNGKIDGIISPDSLINQTQVILVNTIHFKAPWDLSFDPEETRSATFHLNSNEPTQVAMMTAANRYTYGELQELNATAVIIPYQGERFSMHVYIPKEEDGLADVFQALKNTSMDEIRAHIKQPGICEEVHLSLPKFKIQSELKLTKPLKQLGAKDMFSANLANFTGISDDAKVYVSSVVQKAFITVDEAGTEAAAVSSIQAGPTCFPSITKITADRPFYFQIVDDKMGVVLFAGAVHDPREGMEAGNLPTVEASADEYDDHFDNTTSIHGQSAPRLLPTSAAVDVVGTAEKVTADFGPKIVFATSQGGIKVYSQNTKAVEMVVNSTAKLRGVAWDSKHQQLYFCTANDIYRAEFDGTGDTRLLTPFQYGEITALDFDWITSNLYGVTTNGSIFACKTTSLNESLHCVSVLSGQGSMSGISLNPNEGIMYWTESSFHRDWRNGSIHRANMDGTNVEMVVTGLTFPGNIVVDRNTSRLLWTDYSKGRIMSSDMSGQNVTTVVQLTSRLSGPWGIAAHGGKLFWGTLSAMTLQSANKSGQILASVKVGSPVGQLAMATPDIPNTARQNQCALQECAGICALTPTSFRCIA